MSSVNNFEKIINSKNLKYMQAPIKQIIEFIFFLNFYFIYKEEKNA